MTNENSMIVVIFYRELGYQNYNNTKRRVIKYKTYRPRMTKFSNETLK